MPHYPDQNRVRGAGTYLLVAPVNVGMRMKGSIRHTTPCLDVTHEEL